MNILPIYCLRTYLKHVQYPLVINGEEMDLMTTWGNSLSLWRKSVFFDFWLKKSFLFYLIFVDRVRSGEVLHIPQAERYSTKDWFHNLKTIPSSRLLKRIRGVVMFNSVWSLFVYFVHNLTNFRSPGSRCHSLLGKYYRNVLT